MITNLLFCSMLEVWTVKEFIARKGKWVGFVFLECSFKNVLVVYR